MFQTIHLVQEDHYEKIPYQPYHVSLNDSPVGYQIFYALTLYLFVSFSFLFFFLSLSLFRAVSVGILQTIPLAPEELEEKIQCRVLDCDSISQVKHKILDALYRNTPFSLRPSIHEVDLGKTANKQTNKQTK